MRELWDFLEILILLPFYGGYVLAADRFCKKYLGISRRRECLFVTLLLAGYVWINWTARQAAVPYIAVALAGHIYFVGMVAALFWADLEKKILTAAVVDTAAALVSNFGESLFSILLLVWRHREKGMQDLALERWEICLVDCVGYVAVIGAIVGMSRRPIFLIREKSGKWLIFSAVPLLVIREVVNVMNWGACNGILVRSAGNVGIYYDQLFSHGGICVLMAISMFAAGVLVLGMDKICLEQKKRSQYQFQAAANQMRREQYLQLARLRHDLKNHIISLSGLVEDRDWEKIENYLEQMKEKGGFGAEEVVTGNTAVDALLCQKRKQAKENGIRWECDVQLPRERTIPEFDLCVLLGNLLDNAIEACGRMQSKEERFIRIQSRAIKKCFLLEIRNSMETQEAKDITRKKGQDRGIGLWNVRDVIDCYDGTMDVETKDGTFTISVLLSLQ